ncbi:helix-turn-helix domain-containing protein [Streptomyces sp. NPDC002835]
MLRSHTFQRRQMRHQVAYRPLMSPGPRAVEVALSAEERAELIRWASGVVAPRCAERARIVLACADGTPNARVAAEVGVTVATVRKWRGKSSHRKPARDLSPRFPVHHTSSASPS